MSSAQEHDLASVVKEMRCFIQGHTADLRLTLDSSMLNAPLRMDIFVQATGTRGNYRLAGYNLLQHIPLRAWHVLRYRQWKGQTRGPAVHLSHLFQMELPDMVLCDEALLIGNVSVEDTQKGMLAFHLVRQYITKPPKPAQWIGCSPVQWTAPNDLLGSDPKLFATLPETVGF